LVGWRAVVAAAFPPFGRIQRHGDGLSVVGWNAPVEVRLKWMESHAFEPTADVGEAHRPFERRFRVAICR
jgi:hypothetical protein